MRTQIAAEVEVRVILGVFCGEDYVCAWYDGLCLLTRVDL